MEGKQFVCNFLQLSLYSCLSWWVLRILLSSIGTCIAFTHEWRCCLSFGCRLVTCDHNIFLKPKFWYMVWYCNFPIGHSCYSLFQFLHCDHKYFLSWCVSQFSGSKTQLIPLDLVLIIIITTYNTDLKIQNFRIKLWQI